MKKRIKKNKSTKKIKKSLKRKILNWILIIIMFLAILTFIGIIAFGYYIVKSAPEFNPDLLYEKEATLIYDSGGKLIASLGSEKREKVTYDELPEVLVDAIVATEDSRFFQHNGFDLPRFAKASIGQLLGNSGAGGASTITMQVSKNTFTSTEASGIQGIIRKFTDIYMSIFKIENYYTKEEILEFYVNAPFLGSHSYGVEQASQSYFGKHVSDLSLSEAALIAGLFQAPSAYDPYVNPEAAKERRDTVLNLMVRHGYITKKQKEAAAKISVERMLSSNGGNTISEYQGFIDTVVVEVQEKTGNDPYTVPMEIYTTMNRSKQNVINNFYKTYKFKNVKVQAGLAVVDNDTGAILAVGAGRNKTRELSFNYATMIKRHPGSTAKPLFVYGPGFEYYKWSTYTPFWDEKTYYSTGQVMKNFNSYSGKMVSLKKALSKSMNTAALQGFQRLENEKVYEFVTSLGIQPETENGFVNEAHAVGAFTGVNPVQMAGAYAAFANGGYHTTPYSVTKVVYRDNNDKGEQEVYEPVNKKKKVISAQTGYMLTNVLYAVTPSGVSPSGTRVATKTGTSSYDSKLLKSVGLSNLTRDSWMISYSPDYTVALWYGYDELNAEYKKNGWYERMGSTSTQRNKIMKAIGKKIFEKNSTFKNPGGIVSAKVELETVPAQKPSTYTPSSLIETHLFIAGTEPAEVSSRYSKLSDVTNLTKEENDKSVTLSWTSPGTPSAIDPVYLKSYFDSGYGDYATKYYNQRISYNNNKMGTFGFRIYAICGSASKQVAFTNDTTYTVNMNNYDRTCTRLMVKSSYSIFTSNMSSGIMVDLSTYEEPVTINLSLNPVTLTKDSTWTGSTKTDISSLIVNGEAINDYTINNMLLTKAINSSNVEVLPGQITTVSGTYKATYSITFSYTSQSVVKKYTVTSTQNVTVN